MPVTEVPEQELCPKTLPMLISAFNVRGALCRDSGMEAHEANILSLCSSLHAKGCVVAVLSKPRFAPGMVWPDWSGYKLIGERVNGPGSVAVLVLSEVASEVREVDGVGDVRAIWLELQWVKQKRQVNQSKGLLILGVYAPHVGQATEVRRHFWLERQREYRALKKRPKYEDWDVLVVGDFNLHFKFLGTANARYERTLDREVLAMLQDPAEFGCCIGNPPGVRTHNSGTIIDVAAGSCRMKVDVLAGASAGAPSDHSRLDVAVQGRVAACSSRVGRTSWKSPSDGQWEAALGRIPWALSFITAWSVEAMQCPEVRCWIGYSPIHLGCSGLVAGGLLHTLWTLWGPGDDEGAAALFWV